MSGKPTKMECRVAEAIQAALYDNVVTFHGNASLLDPILVARAAIRAMYDAASPARPETRE